jgi:hypothetical protein
MIRRVKFNLFERTSQFPQTIAHLVSSFQFLVKDNVPAGRLRSVIMYLF